MKSAFTWLFVIALVAGGGGYGLLTFHRLANERAYQLELAQLKRTFLTETAGLSRLEPEAYRREVVVHLTRYFAELDKLAQTYPAFYDPERERTAGVEQLEKGQLDEQRKAARDERIDMVLALMQQMKSGQYRPLYTAADNSFRFDIYDIKPETIAGKRHVKVSFVHWGAFGPLEYRSITGNIRTPDTLSNGDTPKASGAAKGTALKAVPQITAEGQPPSMQIKPERWVAEFIPGVEIGYYEMPRFPHNATAVQFTFDYGIRTVGGTQIPVTLAFPDIPVANAWKLAEDELWEALERPATDEEIRQLTGHPGALDSTGEGKPQVAAGAAAP